MAETPKGKKFSEMSKEELSACGKAGGIASGEAKRRKKAMRETLEVLLSMPMKSGKSADIDNIKDFASLKGKNICVQEALIIAMLQRAMKGDVKAAEFVRDTVGDAPDRDIKEMELERRREELEYRKEKDAGITSEIEDMEEAEEAIYGES